MRDLIAKWRRQAEVGDRQGLTNSSLRAEALRDCADELELAWHEHLEDDLEDREAARPSRLSVTGNQPYKGGDRGDDSPGQESE